MPDRDSGGDTADSNDSPIFVDDDEDEFRLGTLNDVVFMDGRLQLPKGVLTGEYVSRVFDAGETMRWSSLQWLPAQPYGKPLPDMGGMDQGNYERPFEMTNNVLLLHFDEAGPFVSNARFRETSGYGNEASLLIDEDGSPIESVQGVFGLAVQDWTDSSIAVDGRNPELQPGQEDFTWSLWIKANESCHASFGHDAYMGAEETAFPKTHIWMGCLRSDDAACKPNAEAKNGRPSATVCSDIGGGVCLTLCGDSPLPDSGWHHLAMRKEGHPEANVALWFDGKEQKSGPIMLNDTLTFDTDVFGIGQFGDANIVNSDSQGILDEVAIFRRALSKSELEDLFFRSVQKLRLQVRVCGDPECADAPEFVGPEVMNEDRTKSFYEDTTAAPAETPVSFEGGLTANRYFQYRVEFETVDGVPSPQLLRVTVHAQRSLRP